MNPFDLTIFRETMAAGSSVFKIGARSEPTIVTHGQDSWPLLESLESRQMPANLCDTARRWDA